MKKDVMDTSGEELYDVEAHFKKRGDDLILGTVLFE